MEVFILDEHLNLRGNRDKLKYYRFNETGTFEERSRLLNISNETTTKIYFYPKQDRIIFDEEEVKKFSLDQYGESIPFIEGELTIFNNYFFDFWGFYLGASVTSFYGHLKRYAYGNKDFCYPKFDLIAAKMDRSRKTLLTYLEILERYGFAFKFNVMNESKDNVDESPLFKIRKQTPLLSHKLIYGDPSIEIPKDAPTHIKKILKKEKQGLPPALRKEHEKFVEQHIQNNAAAKLEQHIDYEKIYSAWAQYGELLKSHTKKESNLQPKNKLKISKNMNEQEKILLNFIFQQAAQKVSKPSFDTWFKELLLKIDHKTYTIYAPNEFARDWLEERYSVLIKDCLNQIEPEIENLHFDIY